MENIIINIDSRFRNTTKYPNPAYFVQNLSENIKNCKYIRVSTIELPQSNDFYYSLNSNKDNQNFILTINNQLFNIVVPTGSYNKQSIISAIQSQLSNNNLNININNNSNYVTISNNLNTPVTINFSNNSNYPSLGRLLGFQNNTYIINNNRSISAELCLNLLDNKYFLLRINDFGTLNTEYSTVNMNNAEMAVQSNRNFMAKILYQNNNYLTNTNNISKSHIFKQPVNINKLEIELVDSLGNRLDMNLNEFSLTIEIGIVTNSELFTKMEADIYRSNVMPMFNLPPYY
jgi:hypothetical protein